MRTHFQASWDKLGDLCLKTVLPDLSFLEIIKFGAFGLTNIFAGHFTPGF